MEHVFSLGNPIELEESMTCEFKEVRGQSPIQAIGKKVDEYVVAFLNETAGSVFWGIRDKDHRVVGVHLNQKMRDELRQIVGQKISAIAPPVSSDWYHIPFHKVVNLEEGGLPLEDTFVIEVCVRTKGDGNLYLTGSGEAYRKTMGGTRKLSGAELLIALLPRLHEKAKNFSKSEGMENLGLPWMPSIARRAKVVRPLLHGGRVLWVDDNPSNNIYERTVLASLGVSVDLALSTEEALYFTTNLKYDLILSDMKRGRNPNAGTELLEKLLLRKSTPPLVFYVGHTDSRPPPSNAFAITNRPDEVLHYIFDVLERRTE